MIDMEDRQQRSIFKITDILKQRTYQKEQKNLFKR